MTAPVKCDGRCAPDDCMCAMMREQVPAWCPITPRVEVAWAMWSGRRHDEAHLAMYLAMYLDSDLSDPAQVHHRAHWLAARMRRRRAGESLGRAIAAMAHRRTA